MIFIALLALQEALPSETVRVPDTDFQIEMVRVPGGVYRDGERDLVVGPFWISRREVTWNQFAHYYDHLKHYPSHRRGRVDGVTRPSLPHEPPDGRKEGWEADDHPVINVKWHGMMAFCRWLSGRTGRPFRLPTEAEWEVAARAGRAADGPTDPSAEAWHAANSGGQTRRVGTRAPNPWGLYDMLGNVWEHCLEFDGRLQPDFVLRGGGWDTPPAELRFGARRRVEAEWSARDSMSPKSVWWFSDASFVGFRVVAAAEPPSPAEQDAYAARIRIEGLSVEKPEDPFASFARGSGTVTNPGDRAIAELELEVYFLDEEGAPLRTDPKGRATFVACYPALVHSAQDGEHRRPLGPGERRRFSFFVPDPRDEAGPLPYEQLGAAVTGIRFVR